MKSDATFDKIKARMAKINPEARTLEAVYKFVIQENGAVKKTWVLDLKAVNLFEGDNAAADCTLTVEDEVMVSLGAGTLTIQEAIGQGKLTVEGNLELAAKLAPFVSSL